MVKKIIIQWGMFMLFGASCTVHHSTIDPAKLDPAFATLLVRKKGKTVPVTSSHKPIPTERRVKENATPEKGYECIVYTKQPDALRRKGIAINSEFPSFVTAWATLKQIEQMASMAEVRYIEAPENSLPQHPGHAP